MVDYYRLKDMHLQLGAGTRIIKRAEMAELEEATDVLAAARQKAAEIVAEAERLREVERRRGYEEGLKTAETEAFERLIREQALLDDALERSRAEITDLVLGCARSIVQHFDPVDVAVSMTRSALGRMRREKRCQLFAPASIAADIQSRVAAILADFPEIELVDVVEDASLTAPDVVLVSALGRVSCSLDDAIAALEAALRGGGMGGRSKPEPAAVPQYGAAP
jgi:type III secretion protein L